jgi:hypothetical protein
MGRIRKTLRWTFSVGGGGPSPIRAESNAEQAAREQTALLRSWPAMTVRRSPALTAAHRPTLAARA